MRVVWYTIRNFEDMCATTPIEIAKRLVERGYKLTIVNSDNSKIMKTKMVPRQCLGKTIQSWLSGEKDSTEHEKKNTESC